MAIERYWRHVHAWEYRAIGMWDGEREDVGYEINALGDQGWELTGIIPMTATPGRAMFYFKRPNGFAEVEHDAAGRNLKGE